MHNKTDEISFKGKRKYITCTDSSILNSILNTRIFIILY